MHNKSLIYLVLIFFSFLCLGASFLNVVDYAPWYRFVSNIFVFLSLFFLILALIFNKDNYFPNVILMFFLLSLIPIIQYIFGVVNHFSTAFLSSSYIFILLFGVFLSFNLFRFDRKFIHFFLVFIIFLGCIQVIISYMQWLNIKFEFFSAYENNTRRVYGSFRQPNNLASYLLICYICIFYYIERELIGKKISFFLLLNIIFCLVLTQSRSGILFFILMCIYFIVFSKNFKSISRRNSVIYLFIFIILNFSLPTIQKTVNYYFDISFLLNQGLVDRVSTGYDRFDIWKFFVNALVEAPWYGYGWYQTQIVQYENLNSLRGFFTSTHNIILDLLLWNGIYIGSFIVFIFSFLFFNLYRSIKKSSDYIIFLCLMVLVSHSMFEYPLFYPGFILLFSIFFGYLLYQGNFSKFKSSKFILIFFIFSIAYGIYFVYKDYMSYQENKIFASNSGMGYKQKYNLDIKILDVLEDDLYILSVNKFDKLNSEQIARIERLVANNMTFYNLLKFSQILYNNGQEEKLEQVVHKLNILYNYRVDKAELMGLQL